MQFLLKDILLLHGTIDQWSFLALNKSTESSKQSKKFYLNLNF
jgi:hypothetical protein